MSLFRIRFLRHLVNYLHERPRLARDLAVVFATLCITAVCGLTLELANVNHSAEQPLTTEPNPFLELTTSPPTDTLTLTVTWDQWLDIQNAILFLQGEISTTLEFAQDTLPISTIEQSHAIIQRYKDVHNNLMTQATDQTAHITREELDALIDHQHERSKELMDVFVTLQQARIDWFTETLDKGDPIVESTTEARDHTPIYELDDCAHWLLAADHIGQDTCIYGNVTSTYDSGSAFFINFSISDTSFYAVSFDWVWDDLQNDCVIVYGAVERYQGRPQIVIEDLDQLRSCYQ